MKTFLLTLLTLFTVAIPAKEPPTAEIKIEASVPSQTPAPGSDAAQEQDFEVNVPDSTNDVVAIGHDATLAAGESANSVVAVLGSATSAGQVSDAVVSVLGNTRVTGPVRDAAVAVLGNVYVDSPIGGDAVAVLGNVELGPHAVVGGDVVAVLGDLKRDPAAVIHGGVQNVLGGLSPHFEALHPWIRQCLMLGRPLGIGPGLTWAWILALGFLAFYILLALLFRDGIDRCVRTLEEQPGRSLLAALLALLLTPILFVLLCITVIGIAVIPILGIALFIASLFGKAAMLAWLGQRIGRLLGHPHTAIAVLIGGAIVTVLYLVPFVGFIVYKLLGILGLGVVVYTLILTSQRHRATEAAAAPPPAEPPAPAAPPAGDAATLPRAGFWIRMGALFLDVVLVGIILALVRDAGKIELLVLATYGAIMWKLKGSTIGGIICGLKVVRLDGRAVDWPTAIVRALGCFLSLAIVGLGFFWIAFDQGKQAWHDKIAGTAVVRAPKGASLV